MLWYLAYVCRVHRERNRLAICNSVNAERFVACNKTSVLPK